MRQAIHPDNRKAKALEVWALATVLEVLALAKVLEAKVWDTNIAGNRFHCR
jgi:hypothetical protein